jgi:hypothetical protein
MVFTASRLAATSVLDGKASNQVIKERLRARRTLSRPELDLPEGRAGPDDIAGARLVVGNAQKVSQPDRWAKPDAGVVHSLGRVLRAIG